MVEDPAWLHPGHASRSASFENPSAEVSAGGREGAGRKGAPARTLQPQERVVLCDLTGPGRITHLWMTIPPGKTPSFYRSQVLEVFYDGSSEPSISVPASDFFGAVHGVAAPYASSLTAVNEGRGYSSRVPMPFRERVRVEWQNVSPEPCTLYYQVDVLLGPVSEGYGLLHAAFRRENPTTLHQDFVVTQGLRGPGRFLGWTGGLRVHDPERWWGEGEVKVYLDGASQPTICGTGTEDYLDSAWGLGTFHAPEAGAPLVLKLSGAAEHHHELVGWYRWHLSDPILFQRELRVTIQQIGAAVFLAGQEEEWERFKAEHTPAAGGWQESQLLPGAIGWGLYERSDDWCATSFVYCSQPQSVPRLDIHTASEGLLDPSGLEPVRRTP